MNQPTPLGGTTSADLFEHFSGELPEDPMESIRHLGHQNRDKAFVEGRLAFLMETSLHFKSPKNLPGMAPPKRAFEDTQRLAAEKPATAAADASVAQTRAREETLSIDSSAAKRRIRWLNPTENINPVPSARGAYKWIQRIGIGGFGEVWEAEQLSLGRTIAIKQLKESLATSSPDPSVASDAFQKLLSFRQEAYTAAFLEHPNIIPVYDLAADERGYPVIAMKRVQGRSWARILEDDLARLPYDQLLEIHLPILIQVSQAVAFAHSRCIIHRDIKPSQVMIGDYGEVLLMDWGLAISLPQEMLTGRWEGVTAPLQPTLQWAENPAGTPCYMAPEQAAPHVKDLGPWTDVYLLASTLYHLLSGRPPHAGKNSREVMNRVARGQVTILEKAAKGRMYPAELGALVEEVMRCAEPRDRPTVKEFIRRLREFEAGDTKRRESMALTASVSEIVRAADLEYRDFAQMQSQLTDAVSLWPANPDIPRLREQVTLHYAQQALRRGDLSLARTQGALLLDGILRERILTEVAGSEARLRRRELQRRVAIGAGALLLAVSIGASALAWQESVRAQARTVEAERAMLLARDNEAAALDARERSDRNSYFSGIGFAQSYIRESRSERAFDLITKGLPLRFRGWEWGFLLAELTGDDAVLIRGALNRDGALFHGEFSPDGTQIAVGRAGGLLELWDARTLTRSASWNYPLKGIWSATWSPDGSRLFLASTEGKGHMVDPASGEHLFEVFIGTGKVMRGARFTPDGSMIATTGTDNRLTLWDAKTGALRLSVDTAGPTYEVDIHPSGRLAAVGMSFRGGAALIDLMEGVVLHRLGNEEVSNLSVTFSPDGGQVVVVSGDQAARVYDVNTGEEVLVVRDPNAGLRAVAWHPDGRLFATAATGGLIRLWDSRTGAMLARMEGPKQMEKLRFHPEGGLLLSTSFDEMRLWNIDRISPAMETIAAPGFGTVQGRTCALRILSFPLDRTGIWANYDDRWLPKEGRLVFRRGEEVIDTKSFYSHHDPTGRWRLDIGYRDFSATIRFADDQAPLTLAPSGVFSAAISPDGDRVALAMLDGSLRVFESARWEEMAGRPASGTETNTLWSMAFSADGKRLALGWQRGSMAMWDVGLAKAIWENPQAHDRARPVVMLEFSPDGRWVLSASSDETARVWSADRGILKSVLRGHTLNVTSARWSPDGERILTTSLDETVKLWVPSTGQEVVTLFDLKTFTVADAVMGAAFSDDGLSVHIATRNGQLHAVRTLPWKTDSFSCEPDAEEFLRCLEEWKRVTRLGAGMPLAGGW